MWFRDALGNLVTTVDGKPPSGHGVQMTIADGSGQNGNGWWNGTYAVPNTN
jgi:hypothetical protein